MIKEQLIKKLGQSSNIWILGPVTLLTPRWYFRGLFDIVRKEKFDWGDKKACVTLSFDCDFREDVEMTPKLLEILSQYSYKTSFACVGKWIEQFPDEHRMIVEHGHEIVNHTYSHPNNEALGNFKKFNELSEADQEAEVVRFHEVCQEYLQYEPIGFRVPHFGALFTSRVYQILKKLHYAYSSSLVAAKAPTGSLPFRKQNGVIEFPVSPCPEHPFGILDTHHAYRKKHAWHRKPGTFYALFEELLEIGIQAHAHINLYFDPRDVMQHEDCFKIFELVSKKQDDVHVLTYAEIVTQIKNGTLRVSSEQ